MSTCRFLTERCVYMDKDNKLAQAIILILVFPIAVLMMLFMTLYTPIDFLIYRFSDFYKDMRCIWGKRVRYVWLITNTEHYKLYNLIVKNSVPIQYLPREDNVCEGGFFYLNNTLFVEDALLCYNSENREWYIVYGHHESQSLEEYAELKKMTKHPDGNI